MGYKVAVLGATGVVGKQMMEILAERKFPVDELVPMASARSAGNQVEFKGEANTVVEATPEAFAGIDIVLSSAGGSISEALLPEAAKHGAVSIDNTSAFRMDPEVPLVVPEVNGHRIPDYTAKNIIANPNCSTIQMVLALKPLHEAAGLRRVIVSTYQSVSGAGKDALDDLFEETRSLYTQQEYERKKFPRPIAFNVLPEIDVFRDDGDTKEEWKMRVETPKILEAEIPLHATAVRVPVFYGHSEAIWIETERPLSPEQARDALAAQDGIEVMDDPANAVYPTARETAGTDATYVGRIRRDPTCEQGLALWVVSDNIRKGAATNAVQIAERLIEHWQTAGRP